MPSDDYAPIGGGGALKLKGAKVDKKKKKKKAAKSDLEKNLDTSSNTETALVAKDKDRDQEVADEPSRREVEEEEEEDGGPQYQKTESELKYEEFKKKKFLKMAESSASRPELLKTHKERVEELNTYLSKLSEHHDMPKIGPG